MRTGRTAIVAIVSDAPTSASSPNVIPVAARATASGSSRIRTRNTAASTSAITSRAPTSRTPIPREIESVRSETTTGAPVTT
jgi:hypothetical protein